MHHPGDAELLAAADPGEPAGEARAAVLTHVGVCEPCASRFAALGDALEAALASLAALDVYVPPPEVRDLMVRGRRRRAPHALARAAALAVLFAGAASAAALTWMPIREWAARAVGAGSETPRPPAVTRTPRTSGVALTPDGPLEIALPGGPGRGAVLVVVEARSDVRVRASDPRARFSLSPGRLVLDAPAETLEVEVALPPRGVPLTLTAGGRVLLEVPAGAGRALSPGDTFRVRWDRAP